MNSAEGGGGTPRTPRTPRTPTLPHVSVVVPTHKRPQLLERCLRALFGQRGVAGEWEPDRIDAERNTGALHGAEFVTANCFVRRAALARCDGFDERFERPWREDSDLYFSLLEAACRVVAAPAAIVIHPARRAPPGTSIHRHRNLLFEALLFKKHRRLYREKISAAPPLAYYLTAIAALATIGGLAAGQALVASLSSACWGLLTVRLATRRLRGTSPDWINVADIVFSSVVIPVVAVFWRLAGALRFCTPFA